MTEQRLSCKNCATSVPENTIFCPNCGTLLRATTNTFTAYSMVPPPPPPPEAGNQPRGRVEYPPPTGPQGYTTSPYQSRWIPPSEIQPTPEIRPQRQKRNGFKVIGILLVLLLLFGAAGYFAWKFVGEGDVSNGGRTTPGSTATLPPAYGGSKTIPINATVTYADDILTIISVQQAQHFTDETMPGDILRLNIKEQTDVKPPYFGVYGYTTGFHVILPDGNSVQPASIQHSDIPAASITRTNWLDFRVPLTTPADQITLRLGTPTEHTIDLPLKEKVDVSKYQPRTVTPNKLIQYGDLNWTLKTATWRLSAAGNQADKDMSYVVLSFSVDSPSTSAYLSQAVSDTFRLTADGTTTVASKYNTFPQTIASGETGKMGTVGFLVPQDSTRFMLVLPVYDRGGVTSTVQVTTDFQIP